MKKLFSSKSKSASDSRSADSATSKSANPMTNDRLDGLIRQTSKTVKGEAGYWQIKIGGRDVLVITDARHNRMRIMSPVAAQDQLDKAELIRLLEANFGSALDSKYALRDQTLWSVFTLRSPSLPMSNFSIAWRKSLIWPIILAAPTPVVI